MLPKMILVTSTTLMHLLIWFYIYKEIKIDDCKFVTKPFIDDWVLKMYLSLYYHYQYQYHCQYQTISTTIIVSIYVKYPKYIII